MTNKNLMTEMRRMRELAGILNEEKAALNEDILELKQMSKQLYSFLKSKGFPVELTNKIKEPIMPQNPKSTGTITRDKQSVKSDINVETVQIQVMEGQVENVVVAVTPSNVARILVGGGSDWSHKASAKFGNDWGAWQKNPEIVGYVNKLGNELLAQIKSKYPNMVYQFVQEPFYYILKFGYAQTKKGGQLDPNKVKNPAPQQQAAPQQNVAAESVNANKKITLSELRNMVESVLSESDYGNLDWVEELEIDEEGKSGVYDVFHRLRDGEIDIDGKNLSADEAKRWVLDNLKEIVKFTKDGFNAFDTVDKIV